jgi:hypothetical protein
LCPHSIINSILCNKESSQAFIKIKTKLSVLYVNCTCKWHTDTHKLLTSKVAKEKFTQLNIVAQINAAQTKATEKL